MPQVGFMAARVVSVGEVPVVLSDLFAKSKPRFAWIWSWRDGSFLMNYSDGPTTCDSANFAF
jgi:hypothetical protein